MKPPPPTRSAGRGQIKGKEKRDDLNFEKSGSGLRSPFRQASVSLICTKWADRLRESKDPPSIFFKLLKLEVSRNRSQSS